MAETIAFSRYHDEPEDGTRRDFLYLATGAVAAVGSAAALWPFIDSMNPAADVLAGSSVEVDVAPIDLGQRVTVQWRGKPVFIDHRPPRRIAEARAVDLSELIDPQTDANRVVREEWLIVVGSARISVAFRSASGKATQSGTGAAGSARVTARSTIPPGASVVARPR